MSVYSASSDFAKRTYLPGFNNQLQTDPGTMFSLFGLNPDAAVGLEGNEWKLKIQIGDSLGGGAMTQGGSFPTPGDFQSDEASLTLALLAHTIEFDGHEVGLLDSDMGAATAVIAKKMAAAKDAMARDIERQTWMDGTGKLANVASSSGSTITLDATTTAQIDRDRYLWIDDAYRHTYDVVNGTTGAQQVTAFTVSDIAESTEVLTCSATMTSATSAGVVVRSGTWASGGAFTSYEFPGIAALVDDDNTYLGINRSTAGNQHWKAVVSANSGTLRTLTETLIHSQLAKMARRASSGKQPNGSNYKAFGNIGVWNAYQQIMSPGMRYTASERPDIGWGDPLPLMGIPFYKDIHAPRNNIWFLKDGGFKYVTAKHNQTGLMRFKENAGGSIFFQVPQASGAGYLDRMQAFLVGFLGMYTDRPRDFGRLDDITEVAPIYGTA